MRSLIAVSVACLLFIVIVGCGGSNSAQTNSNEDKQSGPSAEGEKYLLESEPPDAKGVIETLGAAKNEEEIVVIGRIGGQTNPWLEGAAFLIVDEKLRPCNEIPGDKCKVPWDYCCEPDLGKSRTLVKIVDESGKLVESDARKLIAVKELQTVVIKGKADRDEDGNLTVLASGLYVKSK